MSRETGIDQAKLDAFTETVASNIDAAYLMPMVALGDRLDLFKDLAAHGPATSSELIVTNCISCEPPTPLTIAEPTGRASDTPAAARIASGE